MSDRDVDTDTALNAKDIENLERRLKNAENKLDDMEQTIQETRNKTPSKEDFQSLESTIKKILLEGNGSEPLQIRVARHDSRIKSLKESFNNFRARVYSMGAVAFGLAGEALRRILIM